MYRTCRLFCFVAVLVASSGLGTPELSWGQSSSMGRIHLPSERGLNQLGLTRAWWGQAVTNTARDHLLYIINDDLSVYVQSSSGMVTAFDAETGRRKWAISVGEADRPIYEAAFNNRWLFVINGMTLYAVDKNKGRVDWNLVLPGQPASSPSSDETRMFVGFLDGSVYAFDLQKTNELYEKQMLPEWSHLTVLWRYKTNAAVTSPAILSGSLAAFSSRDGTLYSVTKEDRELRFQFETDAALSAPPVRYKNTLLLGSEDFNLYCIDMLSGRYNWQIATGSIVTRAPIIIKNEAYVTPENSGLMRVVPEDGRLVWQRPGVNRFLAASPARIYTRDKTENLVVLNRSSGGVVGAIRIPRFVHSVTNSLNDRIFMASDGGLLICLRELGREFPLLHANPDLQPLLPEFTPEEATDAPATTEPAAEPAEGTDQANPFKPNE